MMHQDVLSKFAGFDFIVNHEIKSKDCMNYAYEYVFGMKSKLEVKKYLFVYRNICLSKIIYICLLQCFARQLKN